MTHIIVRVLVQLRLAALFSLLFSLIALSSCSVASSPTLPPKETRDSYYEGPPAIPLSSVQNKRLAGRILEYYDQRLPLAPAASDYVQRISIARDILQGNSNESFRYGVYLSSRLHAFALSSGDIRIHSGLLDVIAAQDELLALLACLQTHINLGHAAEAVEQAYNAAIKEDPQREVELRSPPYSESALRAVAERATLYRFSLQQLSACDSGASATLKKAGLDPQAPLTFLERLKRYEGSGEIEDARYDINKTHPMAQVRQRLLAKELGVPVPEQDEQFASTPFEDDSAEETAATNSGDTKEVFTSLEGSEESLIETAPSRESEPMREPAPSPIAAAPTPITIPEPVQTATLKASTAADTPLPAQEVAQPPVKAPEIKRMQSSEQLATTSATPGRLAVRQESELSPGWYLQVAADTTPESANARVQKLIASSHNAVVQAADVRGTRYYRVLIGPFGSMQEARQLRTAIEPLGVSEGTPFARKFPQ